MSGTDDLLFANKTQKLKNVLTIFEKTSEELEQDLRIMKKWLENQPHLPEIPSNSVFVLNMRLSQILVHLNFFYL